MSTRTEQLFASSPQVAAYDKSVGKMAFFDPSRKDDFLFISGTKVRCQPR